MKTLLTTVASLSLLASPLAATAQTSHGGHAAGGFHGGGSFNNSGGSAFRGAGVSGRSSGFAGRSPGFRGGSYRGGYGRGYYRGGYYGGYGYGGYALGGLGLGLIAGAALSDSYGYPGYYAPYSYGYDYPPVYYDGPSQACGHWIWNAARSHYDWYSDAC